MPLEVGNKKKVVWREKNMKICKRCLMTDQTPNIYFDEAGVCNYCHAHDDMEKRYPIDKVRLQDILDKVHTDGIDNEFDCVVGVSGGCDSMYMLWRLVKQGMNPIAVHWDNNWNSMTAKENMRRVTEKLDIPVETIGVSEAEYDDICRSFLLGGTIDMDIPNDIALTEVLYRVADKYDVGYIMNGHSFRTEGFTPLGWTYMDGKYIESVHDKFGRVPMTEFPNLTIDKFLGYVHKKIRRVRPLYHMNFNKKYAKEALNREFGWEWYGGHHAENLYTKFIGNYMLFWKFKKDLRYVEYSALVRSGQVNRDAAWVFIHHPPQIEPEIIDLVKERLRLDGEQFESIIRSPVKTYLDYETYHEEFKQHRKEFEDACNDPDGPILPYTFVTKYCR